jgi:hypothetical protein
LIQKLRPNQEYYIEFQKDEYHTWKKRLQVFPEIVTEAYVMMIPKVIVTEEIFPFFDHEGEGSNTPITGFTKISKTVDGRIIPENEEYIDLVTLFEGENPYEIKVPEVVASESLLPEEKVDVPEYYVELGIKDSEDLNNFIESSDEVAWIHEGNIVQYWIGKEDSIAYYYCGGKNNRVCNDEISLDWKSEIKKFKYLPDSIGVWLVLTEEGLFAVEIDPRSERNVQPIYIGHNIDFEIDESETIFVNDKGSFFELDL